MSARAHRRQSGRITLIELLTIIVAVVVLAAIAIPLWQSRQLDARRAEARVALEALQQAQDAFFAAHARYADRTALHAAPPHGLGLGHRTPGGHFELELERSADALGFVAIAREIPAVDRRGDLRCREFRLDQQGRRTATNAEGEDTTADCWRAR